MKTAQDKTEVTVTVDGHKYSVTLVDGRVEIARDGVWAGTGRWVRVRGKVGYITDCAACFGVEDVTERVYAALDAALRDAMEDGQ